MDKSNFSFDTGIDAKTSLIENDPIKISERAFLQWTNVSYYVPAKYASSALDDEVVEEDIAKGLPSPVLKLIKGKNYK